MTAPSGQNAWHQRRSTNSSRMRKPAKKTMESEGSLNSKRRQSAITSANVSPTGQMRQKTGNPKTAEEASAPPSTQKGPVPGLRPARSASVRPSVDATSSPFPPEMQDAHADGVQAAVFEEHAPAFSAGRSSFMPVMRRRSGTGQTQPQKIRPKSTTTAATTSSPKKACGRKVLSASIASSAPSGQTSAMLPMPKDDRVPQPVCQARPMPVMTMNAAAVRLRRRLLPAFFTGACFEAPRADVSFLFISCLLLRRPLHRPDRRQKAGARRCRAGGLPCRPDKRWRGRSARTCRSRCRVQDRPRACSAHQA